MKTLASISAVLCTAVLLAIAIPHSNASDDRSGAQPPRAAITVPSRPGDFQPKLTGTDWWAGPTKAGPRSAQR